MGNDRAGGQAHSAAALVRAIDKRDMGWLVGCSAMIGLERKVRVAKALGIAVRLTIDGRAVAVDEWTAWSEALGRAIGERIARRGLSYGEAAKLVGSIDKAAIGRLVNRDPKVGLERKIRVAVALGIRLNLLIDGQLATATTGAGSRRKKVAVISRPPAALPLAA